MPSEDAQKLLDIALDALEQAEFRSLSWGFIDGSFGESEAETVIEAALIAAKKKGEPADLLDQLVDAHSMRQWPEDGERRYRTRFSDLLRLLVRSRQLFPNRPWQSAPTLVSDFRVDVRPRTYPKRDIKSDAGLDICEDGTSFSELQSALWTAFAPKEEKFSFARFQIETGRRLLRESGEHGTIVTAGTGSGKTLAFYLPAFIAIADSLKPNDHWTRALTLYPRQELLKDQLSEAYKLAYRVSSVLEGAGKRQFAFGSLYGGTPIKADSQELQQKGWRRLGTAFVCPFVRCPICDAEMKWKKEDIDQSKERLICTRPSCSGETTPETLRLTRKSIQAAPPDFIFTTTEMLNQRLADTRMRHLFGVGVPQNKRPLFVLLDEVHTYSGTSGAQAALLLRRWRHLVNTQVRWVGLSATLREANHFFADLTGLAPDRIMEITPQSGDMVSEGAEYQLLLRSDPASQAATLSTSIQAAMLIARMLDPKSGGPSNGRFGRRLFAFTDELDATHRLFDNLRDAEAYKPFGKPDPSRVPLAALRASTEPETSQREADGQFWGLAEQLRGTLEERLEIGRTTSRDPGVAGQADVVVATSALEVGFNDPDVGAILQHKAPRSLASFVQRRGRAGRKRGMRPMTIMILSDYGRDRLAFQSYEHLFDPVIERQTLPIHNTYVLRMQAIFALFDWMAQRISQAGGQGWVWDTLSRPNTYDTKFRTPAKNLLRKIVQFDPGTLRDLSRHIQDALRIDEKTLNAVLWEAPRPVLLEVVPTLARRVFCDWRLADNSGNLDFSVPWHPLPDFVPRTLFSELNLPEVQVEVPPAYQNDEATIEPMPILQALTQFTPGRVRRRFADQYGGLAHWVPLDPENPDATIRISDYAPRNEYVGTFPAVVDGGQKEVSVYRPWQMQVEKVPKNSENQVLHTSNATWFWQSDFEFLGDPFVVEVPKHAAWANMMPRLEFHLHRFSTAVSVRRFAVDGRADIRLRQHDGSRYIRFRLSDNSDDPVGVGFAFEADALTVPLILPTEEELQQRDLPPSLERWLKILRFRDAVNHDTKLPEDLNVFRREWLHQVFLLTAIQKAEANDRSFEDTVLELGDEADTDEFVRAVAALISNTVIDEGDGLNEPSALESTLLEILGDANVISRLSTIAQETLTDHGDGWGKWLLDLLRNTLAEAVMQACLIAAPSNTAIEGLTTDVRVEEGVSTVIVAETTLGGGGTIEALTQAFAAEPFAFFRALDAALAPSDLEITADAMVRFIRLSVSDDEIKGALSALRIAADQNERLSAQGALFSLMTSKGIPVSQSLSVSIATRLLRPGSTTQSDQLIDDLMRHWQGLEKKYFVSLTARSAAALTAGDPILRTRLASFGGKGNEIGTAELMLWPQSGELRNSALQSYNPYRQQPITDAAFLRALLLDDLVPTIQLVNPDWHTQLHAALAERGIARLAASDGEESQLYREALLLLEEPVDIEFFQFYPTIEGFRYSESGGAMLELSLRERI